MKKTNKMMKIQMMMIKVTVMMTFMITINQTKSEGNFDQYYIFKT